jgi:hypothetical protein
VYSSPYENCSDKVSDHHFHHKHRLRDAGWKKQESNKMNLVESNQQLNNAGKKMNSHCWSNKTNGLIIT